MRKFRVMMIWIGLRKSSTRLPNRKTGGGRSGGSGAFGEDVLSFLLGEYRGSTNVSVSAAAVIRTFNYKS